MSVSAKFKDLLGQLGLVERVEIAQMGAVKDWSSLMRFEVPVLFTTLFGVEFEQTTLKKVIDALPALREEGPWLAGGALRRTLLGEEPDGDFDLFFRDAKQFKEYSTELKLSGFTKDKKTKNYQQFTKKIAGKSREIQCVNNVYFESLRDLVASFDFTVCMVGYDGQSIVIGEAAIDDLEHRRIMTNVVVNPLKSLTRVLKYAEQGFMPTKECLIRLKNGMDHSYEEREISY